MVVLPFVPVTPDHGHGRGRAARSTAADSGPIAARTEGTMIWGNSPRSRASARRRAPPHPPTAASAANAWPSAVAPGTQKNRQPGRHLPRVEGHVHARGVAGVAAGLGPRRERRRAHDSARGGRELPPDRSLPAGPGRGPGALMEAAGRGGRRHGGHGRDPQTLDRVPGDLREQRCGGETAVDVRGSSIETAMTTCGSPAGRKPTKRRHVLVDVVPVRVDLARRAGLARDLIAGDLRLGPGPVLRRPRPASA